MLAVALRLLLGGLGLLVVLGLGWLAPTQAAGSGVVSLTLTVVPTQSYLPTYAPTVIPTEAAPVPTVPLPPLPGLAECSAPIPGVGSFTFPATGHAVTGIFFDFWEMGGGLAQQGYPISDVFPEVSDLDGVAYQVQYFERAVFEYHPENAGTGYDLLLAQLGTYQYRQKYPTGAPNQRPNGERPRYFAETGHTLGGEFRTYWETHGGLRQQGFPISDEFTELSPLDNKPYTVQYFERAVFEYHPENRDPYRVLLSQLGTLRDRAKYPVGPGPSPTPDPAAARYLGDVYGSRLGLPDVAVGGGQVFWYDAGLPNDQPMIRGYEVAAARAYTIPISLSQPSSVIADLVTDGRTIAWLDGPNMYGGAIHGYSLRAGREFAAPVPYAGEFGGYAVMDDMLYYQHYDGGIGEIHAHNWTTGQDTIFAHLPRGTAPLGVIAGNGYVAWAEGSGGPVVLRVAPAQNPAAVRTIPTGSSEPPIYTLAGDRVIFAQPATPTGASTDIRMYNITSGVTTVVAREPLPVDNLSADGNRVAWRRVPLTGLPLCQTVVVLDLSTGQLQGGAVPTYGGRQVTLAGPQALLYARAGEPFQLYLQSFR